MTQHDFEGRMLSGMAEISANVAGLRGEFQQYQEKVDSDIRELKRARDKTHDSLTDLQMETIRADAIVAKQKLDSVKTFAVGILKWFAIATLGGVGHMLWGIIHR